jgi:HK97 family phage prohead protease
MFERRAAVEAGTYKVAGEARSQEFAAQLRSAKSEKDGKEFVTLRGYASTVDQPYTMYDMFGEYTEQIDRNAFNKTLASGPDVNFLVNHTGLSMARTTNGTLRLGVDDTGFWQESDLNPQRSDVRDLDIAIQDGNVDQMSFAFRIVDGKWSPDYTAYTITEVDMNRGDVSAVNYGANPNTSIAARAKPAFDAVDHLDGEPLRILAARANAKLRASEQETAAPPVGPNAATLAARLALEED